MHSQNTIRSIPVSHFSLQGLPQKERFSVWTESASILFDVKLDPAVNPDDFDCSVTTYHFGTLLLMEKTLNPKQVSRRTRKLIAKDGMDHIVAQVIRRGNKAWQCRGASFKGYPGDIVLLDFSQPVEIQTQNQDSLTLFLPRQALAQHLKSPEQLHGRVLRRQSPLALLFSEHLRTLQNAATAPLTRREIDAMAGGLISLSAHYFGDLATTDGGAEREKILLPTICRYLEQHFRDRDLSPDALAGRFHTSRAQLYRMFKPYGGVAHFVQEQRLSWCLRELMKPSNANVQISEIAYRAGFENGTHFSRLFRETFGITPREVREGGHRVFQARIDGGEVDRSFEGWLRSLGRNQPQQSSEKASD
jgi:AraC-like DNA-binding protein